MEALQGYMFDDKKPDSPHLRIYFAHFPFSLPSDPDEDRIPFGSITPAMHTFWESHAAYLTRNPKRTTVNNKSNHRNPFGVGDQNQITIDQLGLYTKAGKT
ncbi:hypothetical protein SAY86_022143 [Trapa natans]|uniref:Uncharacterized protein n=1 Tax=Trapa natans TaxID=22666 RepID=A0AAN7ME49_TRANT|nr:hypothetical protein SAY86_022143 [Trapa natans]